MADCLLMIFILTKFAIPDDITGPVGNRTVAHHREPKVWHVVFADAHTCAKYDLSEVTNQNFIDYDIQLLNPDALGNPVEHFSDEETGYVILLFFLNRLNIFYDICLLYCRISKSRVVIRVGRYIDVRSFRL